MVDPLYVSLMCNRISEAVEIKMALDSSSTLGSTTLFGENFHKAVREAIIRNDSKLFNRIISIGFNGIDPMWSWTFTGSTLFHVAVMYGRFKMASTILDAGDDPRYPFVYDPGFRFTQSIKKRRKVVQTMDLIKSIEHPGKAGLLRKVQATVHHLETQERAKKRPSRRSQEDRLMAWTTHMYRDIQEKRRGTLPVGFRRRLEGMLQHLKSTFQSHHGYHLVNGIEWKDTKKKNEASIVNQALAKHMSNHALRVPQLPRHFYWQHTEAPIMLMRGLHGPIARQIRTRGSFKDKGYVAMTTDSEVATQFQSNDGIVLIFLIQDLPKGTPWIWFTPKPAKQSNMVPSSVQESEVLLPPGTIRLLSRYRKGVWYASYEPDREARSVKGRKILQS